MSDKSRPCDLCGAYTSLRIKGIQAPPVAGPVAWLVNTIRLWLAPEHYVCGQHSGEDIRALLFSKAGKR